MRSGSMWYFCGVGPQPADGRLDVVDGRRELVLRGQAVGDGHGDVAVLGEADAQRRRSPRALPARKPPPWMQTTAGNGPSPFFGPGQVQLQVLAVGVGVLDAALEDDALGDNDFRRLGGLRRPRPRIRLTPNGRRTSMEFMMNLWSWFVSIRTWNIYFGGRQNCCTGLQ